MSPVLELSPLTCKALPRLCLAEAPGQAVIPRMIRIMVASVLSCVSAVVGDSFYISSGGCRDHK